MTSINVIAKNNCVLSVNVEGNYNVALTGVTGPYNIKLLKKDEDYLHICTKYCRRYLPKKKRLEIWTAKKEVCEKAGDEEGVKYYQKKIDEVNADTTPDWVSP